MTKKYKDKFDKLANAPIKGLITSLAVPTIFTMLVSAIYNMADSYFVGKIDTSSVASIGIVFSLMSLLQAIGFFMGNGSGVIISTKLGENKKEEAKVYANVSLFTILAVGIILAVAGSFLSVPLAKILGATATTIDNASSYLRYILIGSPFILGSFVLNNHLRFQGSALYSMIGIVSGSVINIILDPLFIFKFNLGVKGAAIATVISQFIGFVLLIFGTFKNDNLRISIKSFKPSLAVYSAIFKNGLPSLARQGINTLGTIAMNFACAPFGDATVAAMSVYNRVLFLGMAIVIGYGQGYQPVCSFNNGAKKYDRVYSGYRFTSLITTVIIICYAIISFIFAPQLIGVFRDDPLVIEVGVKALRYECFAIPVFAYCTISNMLMQSLKISGKATILALARQGIFYIPLMLIMPRIFGIIGVVIVQPIAEIMTFALTITLTRTNVKKLKSKAKSVE